MIYSKLVHYSEQVIDVHGHFVDFCRIVLLNVPQDAHIFIRHEVNCNASAIEAPRPTDPMDVELA